MFKNKKNNLGHNGPYDNPIIMPEQSVLEEWIDYNGHMNVAFYTMVFDEALDNFLDGDGFKQTLAPFFLAC